MSFYARLFDWSRHQRVAMIVLASATFIIALAIVAIAGVFNVQNSVHGQVTRQVEAFDRLDATFGKTIEALFANSALEPCSAEFLDWLRRIAFLPDGVHELIYADNGQILCSVTLGALSEPIALGASDIVHERAGSFWLDRDLAMIGFPGLTGTFIQAGNFMLVAPPVEPVEAPPEWLDTEFVTLNGTATWWHRWGKNGLYETYLEAGTTGFSFAHWGFFGFGCNSSNSLCMVTYAPMGQVITAWALPLAFGIVGAGAITAAICFGVRGRMRKFWSFHSRFERLLSDKSIVCHYQPILSLRSGRIEGVEVLARWRDIDGSLVLPDKFLPIVEARNMTRPFTEMVVRKAFDELCSLPAERGILRVGFNIFPKDFDAAWLLSLFAEFLAMPERFEVVAELVETDQISLEETAATIASLREHGIKTFIDDFGVGYSSIHYLAGLSADGVKLDRSFAMAPKGSLMAIMLTSAIEMIQKTGQELVVEGVETQAGLMALRATNMVDHVQGYHICRPAGIKEVANFLAEHREAEAIRHSAAAEKFSIA